jgi:energy-coupling factor transporter ATP-binding protein EcfA2
VAAPDHAEAIRLDRLSFAYADQDDLALRDLSLSVACGEMVAVMGATGAGKTTLAKCLNRTVPGFQRGRLSGTIHILGRQLQVEGVAEMAGIVGLVSQDFEAQLFATNVVQETVFGMEQLGVPPNEMRARTSRALAAVGLQNFEHRDPSTLSGGEKQRLAIAATLALQPRILVFDEPTTDLDPLGKLEIFAVLGAMRREGYTLVVIEHEIAAAEQADRLIVMSKGRVVCDDTPARVLAQVDFLHQHGVRAPDMSRLAAQLHLVPVPRSVDEAETVLRTRAGTAALPIQARTNEGVSDTGRRGRGSLTAGDGPLVEAESITFQYESGAAALTDVSLRIAACDFIALIGQNGSGKTTLAKHLNGLLHPQSGRVLLSGTNLRELPMNTVAADVGYVFQNPDHQIFAATVTEEVAFGPRNFGLGHSAVADRVQNALEAVGLHGLAAADPFLLGKGQRQRLAVASLLAMRPRLLILDEPTTGLDYDEQRRMMDLLARLHAQGMALLIITHSPWVVAEYAARGVLMSAGRVLFDGPLRDLFAEEALLARAHFQAPEITRLGRRFGFTPLSVEEFSRQLSAVSPQR